MVSTDGRRQRTEKSRERVLEAAIELIEETGALPIAQQIADRSGMSIRTVFRLYEDINDLQASAVRLRMIQLRGRYSVPESTAALDVRVEQIVATWTDVHEFITPVRSVIVGLLDRSDALREQYITGMRYLAGQIAEAFAAELAGFSAAERRRRLDALDVALSWETWHRLRTIQMLSAADARAVMALSVTSILTA